MKTKLMTVLCSATFITCPMWAADNTSTADNNTPQTTQRDRDERLSSRGQRLGELRDAKQILGMEIKDDQGERIGKIKDLALDLQNGRIVEVIVARGGTLGVDEHLVAVPPSAFVVEQLTKTIRLSADREQLKNAPEFKWADWKNATEDSQVRDVYQRFGSQVYYGQSNSTNWNNNTARNGDANAVNNNIPSPVINNNNPAGVITTNATDTAEASNARAQDSRGQASHYYPQNGTNLNDTQVNSSFAMEKMPASMGHITRASKVLGSTAENNQNEKLGKVKNLVIDLPAGRVVEVVLATGGFLGMDSELSAVPPQAFKCDRENETLTLDATRDSLNSAPHYKTSEWDNHNDSQSISQVYSTYHVQPYFNDTAADNTAQNVRDRNGSNLTPLDQGNNKDDINTSAQIRKALMADKDISVNAQNIKIITVNGRVTLRGVVNTEEEKRMAADTAARMVTKDQVDNQLQVRGAANSSSFPNSTPTSTDSIVPTTK